MKDLGVQFLKNSLAIAIPAYDEFENLSFLIPEIISAVGNIATQKTEIIIIVKFDESDFVISSISNLGATVIRRHPSNTFGDAIRTGLLYCENKFEFLIFMDADGSHSPTTITKLWKKINEANADVVVASRYTDGGSSANSFAEIQMSKLLNRIYGIVLGIKVRDVSTNFKIYRVETIRGIKLQCSNYDIVEELLLKVSRKKKSFQAFEIPDHFSERRFGESKRKLTLFIISYVFTLFRLRFTFRKM